MIKHRNNFLTYLCTILIMALFGSGVQAEEKMEPPEPPPAPDGWVFVDEDVWEIVPDTTGRHLHEAWQAFVGERYEESASEMRKAAAVILFGGRCETDVQAKEALMDAVLDLERLANSVDQHLTSSRTLLNHTFARAECALARHEILAVTKEWEGDKRDMVGIGSGLDTAAIHLDDGFLWAGKEIERRAVDAISQGISIGEALKEGTYRDGKQIQAAIEGIEREVKGLGKIVDSFPRVTVGATAAHRAVPLPAPDGYVLIEDEVWFADRDEPGRLLHKARADYTNTHYLMAATDLREASVYLRIEGRRAGEAKIKNALFCSANDLRELAKDVGRGAYVPSDRFSRVFARAHYNLARANQRRASDAWAKKNTAHARQALDAAMTNLQQGFVWSGHEMEASAVKLSKKVESLCAKMAKTTGWQDKEVQEAVKFVGLEINQLGNEL